MKFARYLQDTQTPEWKKAYIDYRALKKRITAVRKVQEGLAADPPSSEPEDDRESLVHQSGPEARPPQPIIQATEDHNIRAVSHEPIAPQPPPPGRHAYFEEPSRASGSVESLNRELSFVSKTRRGSASVSVRGRRPSFVTSIRRGLGIEHDKAEDDHADTEVDHEPSEPLPPPTARAAFGQRPATGSYETVTHEPVTSKQRRMSNAASTRGRRASFAYPKSLASFRRGQNVRSMTGGSGTSRATNPMEVLPLNELLAQLNPTEQAFFTALDAQLDKIEAFYTAREKEMFERSKMLHEQMDELGDHKKLVQVRLNHSLDISKYG
ncbi:hypothetical protein DXG03_002444 [Asterophora parasitica]|uniref:SPX domain-containing protein n=1 Tax=Asterophora parasitica TaxID=117018 RepID=A0A9P7GDL9_9AGAR|nr:hypothetical protein DXG03_002444 [Asterophora parasitica]